MIELVCPNNWINWYNQIRGENWPDCNVEQDFHLLPINLQLELINNYNYDPTVGKSKKYSYDYHIFTTSGLHQLDVFWLDGQDGGGTKFGQDFIPVIKQLYPDRQFKRCYEWCSGPGFIGYSILDHNLAKSICLSDLHYPAIEMAEKTRLHVPNNCKDKVTTYLFKDLELLPKREMFDLVVANPPHNIDFVSESNYNANRICTDINWESHQNFFKYIRSHLTNDGIILLQENKHWSQVSDFESFIISNNLKITNCYYDIDNTDNSFYYIEIQK